MMHQRRYKPHNNHSGYGEFIDFDDLEKIYRHTIPNTPAQLSRLSNNEAGGIYLDAEDVGAAAHLFAQDLDTQRKVWLLADQAVRRELKQ